MTFLACIALMTALWGAAVVLWLLDAPDPRQTAAALLATAAFDEPLVRRTATAADSELRAVA